MAETLRGMEDGGYMWDACDLCGDTVQTSPDSGILYLHGGDKAICQRCVDWCVERYKGRTARTCMSQQPNNPRRM